MELLVYAPVITPRLEYIFRLMLGDIYKIPVGFTSDPAVLAGHPGPRLVYGPEALSASVPFWRAHSLLFEEDVHHLEPEVSRGNIFFPVTDPYSVQEHDPFAAAFYLVSRYEEYLDYKPDSFGRFEACASVSFRKNVLEEPLVNQYAAEVLQILLRFYPGLTYRPGKFRFLLTIDIDQSYSYRHKGILWNSVIFLKNLARLRVKELALQAAVLFKGKPDPYDSFEYLRNLITENKLKAIFFIHSGNRGPHDKVIPVFFKGIPDLIRSLKDFASIGIHPSFRSNEQQELLGTEIKRLEEIGGVKVTASRQHYLRLSFPGTYRNLIREGIKEDYTMGYASRPGFRAGICTPFKWFDLLSNKETNLVVHPITWMEGNFIDYLKTAPGEAWKIMESLEEKVKKVNGQLLTVWHNHTVTDYGEWKGWKKIFDMMVKKMSNRNER